MTKERLSQPLSTYKWQFTQGRLEFAAISAENALMRFRGATAGWAVAPMAFAIAVLYAVAASAQPFTSSTGSGGPLPISPGAPPANLAAPGASEVLRPPANIPVPVAPLPPPAQVERTPAAIPPALPPALAAP
jgi:hypothetical protein